VIGYLRGWGWAHLAFAGAKRNETNE